MKRLISFCLALALILSLAPSLTLTGTAASQTTQPDKLLDTITIYDEEGELVDEAVFQYDEYDRLTSISWDAGIKGTSVSFAYDSAGRLLSIKYGGSGSGSVEYTYNDKGQLIRSEGMTSDFYEYNSAGQLVKVTSSYHIGSDVTTYTYDPSGNLVTKTTVYDYTSGDTPTPSYSTYSYDSQNRVSEIVSVSGSDTSTTTYTYDSQDRVIKIVYTSATSTYTTTYNYDYKPFILSTTNSTYGSKEYTNTSLSLENESGDNLENILLSNPQFYSDSDGYLTKVVETNSYSGEESTWYFTYRDANPQGDNGEVTRLAGDTRFETAFEIADELKEIWGVNKFDTIIIASGTSAADALSGSFLANVKSAPILLSCNADFNPKYVEKYNNMLLEYIQSNLKSGGTVYILGGEKAVDPSLDDALSGYHVVRLAGATRYETNLLILKEAGISTDQEILVCNGTGFAGALASSATGLPILLIKGDSGQLTAEQSAYLKSLPNSYCIIGGPDSISVAFESVINSYGTTVRLSGANRFETSIMVAERYFDDPDGAVLAYAWNYPDGLCGGSLAYAMDAPLILTMTCYEADAAAYISTQGINSGVVLGGTGLISEESVDAIFGNGTTGHCYTDTVVEPTTSARGYTLHTCSKCGHTYKDSYTDPIPDESWKDAYLEEITEQAKEIPTDLAVYYLVYLDEDQIPELWIDYIYTAYGNCLSVYHDGSASSYYLRSGGLCYYSFENIFLHSYGRQGYYGDTVYCLKDGQLVRLAAGTYEAQPDENGFPNYDALDYYWEEQPVSEEQYNNAIAEYIDLGNCETPYHNAQSYTYEEILEYLSN